MKSLITLAVLAITSQCLSAQQSTRTGSGDEYILYPNGTWGRVAEAPDGKKYVIFSNGTWKNHDPNTVINTNNGGNNTNNSGWSNTNTNNTNTNNTTGNSVAQVSDGVLTIWRDSKVVESIKFEYEYDMKNTYFYWLACAPYRYNKTTGEVTFVSGESLGKANSPQEAQSLVGTHYTQNVYKNITGKISTDGTSLTLYSGGNDLRKVGIQKITDLANDAYTYTLEGNSYKHDRKTGEVKAPNGDIVGKAANDRDARYFVAYHFIYKKA